MEKYPIHNSKIWSRTLTLEENLKSTKFDTKASYILLLIANNKNTYISSHIKYYKKLRISVRYSLILDLYVVPLLLLEVHLRSSCAIRRLGVLFAFLGPILNIFIINLKIMNRTLRWSLSESLILLLFTCLSIEEFCIRSFRWKTFFFFRPPQALNMEVLLEFP